MITYRLYVGSQTYMLSLRYTNHARILSVATGCRNWRLNPCPCGWKWATPNSSESEGHVPIEIGQLRVQVHFWDSLNLSCCWPSPLYLHGACFWTSILLGFIIKYSIVMCTKYSQWKQTNKMRITPKFPDGWISSVSTTTLRNSADCLGGLPSKTGIILTLELVLVRTQYLVTWWLIRNNLPILNIPIADWCHRSTWWY